MTEFEKQDRRVKRFIFFIFAATVVALGASIGTAIYAFTHIKDGTMAKEIGTFIHDVKKESNADH